MLSKVIPSTIYRKKNKGIQLDLLVKSFTLKCFFVNIFVKKGKYFPNIPSQLRALASTYYQRKFLLLLTAYTLLTVGTYHVHDILFFMFKCRLFDRSNVWLVYYKQWWTTGKLFLSYSWKFTGQGTGIWISVWQNITAPLLILLLLIRSSTHMCPLLLSLKTYR